MNTIEILNGAIREAMRAGRLYQSADDAEARGETALAAEYRRKAIHAELCALEVLCDLPGDAGEDAGAELARRIAAGEFKLRAKGETVDAKTREKAASLAKAAIKRSKETARGGGVGWRIGDCDCPLEWFAYDEGEIEGVALAYAIHLKSHGSDLRIVR